MTDINRRSFLASTAGASALLGAASTATAAETAAAPTLEKKFQNGTSPWPICLDTATIRPASLEDKIAFAAKAGYDAIEPWDGELADYEKDGGKLEDLGKKIKDAGLFVPSVIGLWNAIPENQEKWEANMEATRNRMRMISAIGAEHAQVIPSREVTDEKWMADRYRDLLEIGLNDYNINPALVFVIFLPGSRRLGQATAIALDSGHPKAKIIPDVFHMYIGDSSFDSLRRINGDLIAIFQFNDAPATPEKAELKDKHRVYPGDGILPLEQSLRDLQSIGFTGCVSVELYNEEYWKEDHFTVAKTGLEKTLAVIDKAL